MAFAWMDDPAEQEPTAADWILFQLANPTVKFTKEQAEGLLTAYRAEHIPLWEAIYEPGNVSAYLIGYLNDETIAKAACESWLRVQDFEAERLEWVPDAASATGRFDAWFELVQHHAEGPATAVGLIVRHAAAGGA